MTPHSSFQHLPRFLNPGFIAPKFNWGESPAVKIEYLVQYWLAHGTRVAVYPSGALTRTLLDSTHLHQVTVALGDSDPQRQGSEVAGFSVLDAPTLLATRPDIVLVLSPQWEDEIISTLQPHCPDSTIILGLRSIPEVPNPIDPWALDSDFQSSFEKLANISLIDERRAFMLVQLARQCLAIDGCFAEVGVYKGASATLLAGVLQNSPKELHLFDTFQGMPPADSELDLWREGELSNTSLDEVRQQLAFYTHTRFYPGLFPETATLLPPSNFSFVHVDVDIHQSVVDCCQFFYPRMAPGGCIIFDDYGYVRCSGAKKAVDTFFADKPEYPCYLPTGQCIVTKHC